MNYQLSFKIMARQTLGLLLGFLIIFSPAFDQLKAAPVSEVNGPIFQKSPALPYAPFQGYIIEFKESSVSEKKNEIENQILELKKSSSFRANRLKQNKKFILKNHQDKINFQHRQFKIKVSELLKNSPPVLAQTSRVLNMVTLDISEEEAAKLAQLPNIKRISPNFEVKANLMDSVPLINADDVWQIADDQGRPVTGQGITIAILDTGIDYTHPDLGGCLGDGCKVIGGYDFINNDQDPMDDHGHGTHVAATAAGKGVLKGVAPAANLVGIKVLSAAGSGSASGVIAGIELALDPNQDDDFSDHYDIISMSLGGSGNPDDPISLAVDNAVSAGVVVTIAAGNSGPSEGTISSPGTARRAITVGASNKTDTMAFFSSRGPVEWTDLNGEQKIINKPDIVAPGVDICAAQWNTWLDSKKCLDDEHIAISGTSMATPHLAGAVALIKQKHPDWIPEEIKATLKATAIGLTDPQTGQAYSLNAQGAGRLDVLAAAGPGNPAPLALLSVPTKVSGSLIDIYGTAKAGDDFQNYSLYYSPFGQNQWSEIITANTAVIEGKLGTWNITQLLDGDYQLKLVVRTQAVQVEEVVKVKIQNTFISSPVDVSDWLKDRFRIWPPAGAQIFLASQILEIKGTAAGYGFQSYNLSWCATQSDCSSPSLEGITLTDNGQASIENGVLGSWDLSVLKRQGSGYYYLTLTVDLGARGQNKYAVRIFIDTQLKEGWPIKVDTWGLVGAAPEQPTIADLDKDGKKELVLAYRLTVKVIDHQGKEVWSKSLPALVSSSPALADLDGDGYLEILVGAGNKLSIFKSDGTPLEGWPQEVGSGSIRAISIEDIDGDGKPDILLTNNVSQLYVVNSQGESLPGWPKNLDTDSPYTLNRTIWSAPALGDIDGDGSQDIVVISFGRVSGATAPSNTAMKVWVLDKNGNNLNSAWPKQFSGENFYSPTLADLDKNGDLEIIFAQNDASDSQKRWLHVFKFEGDKLAGWPKSYNLPNFGLLDWRLTKPTVGDLEGDGTPEVVIAVPSGVVEHDDGPHLLGCLDVLKTDGNSKTGWPKCLEDHYFTWWPTLANLDNDEEIEIAILDRGPVSNEDPLVKLYAFNPDNSVVRNFPKRVDSLTEMKGAPIADLDGDLDNEIIHLSSAGNLSVWDLETSSSASEWSEFHANTRHTNLYKASAPGPTKPLEFGLTWLDHQEKTVVLKNKYQNPVVIVQPLSYHGPDPAHVRITDVRPDSFKMKLEEWAYRDGKHLGEQVSFIVLEAGTYHLSDGRKLEAGQLWAHHKWSQVVFKQSFSEKPVVFTQAQTFNAKDPVITRVQNLNTLGFQVKLQEEEAKDNIHFQDLVGYLAIEPGVGTIKGLKYVKYEVGTFEIANPQNQVSFTNLTFKRSYNSRPLFLASVQTYNEADPVQLRYRNFTSPVNLEVYLEEEQSKDEEITHQKETVSYFVLGEPLPVPDL